MNIDKFRPIVSVAALVGLVLALPLVAAAQQTGTVTGTVTDQVTGQPVAGARVLLGNTNIAAVTTVEGRYTLRSVPVGTHEVRVSVIGYASAIQTVTVEAGAMATADFALRQAVVSLDAVTITATGEAARARELGNAVATVKADQVTQAAPISDFADLLSGRAANVQVLQSSGTTGAGARVRIRGLSSLSLSNEPVYYVDGVRIESGSNSLSVGTGGQSFSRINDINPEDIESVEIIKGPSAATLYGTQAANGVIRITTKRGLAGRPTWLVYSEIGVLNDNNTYPTNYFSWGRTVPGNTATQCFLTSFAAGTCVIDSLTSFNVLMNDSTTFLGTGWRGQVGAQVSGGSEQARYFFSAEYEDELGHYRLPEGEYARIAAERQVSELPYETYRPNDVKKFSVRSNVQATLSNRADVSVNLGLVKSDGRLPQNDNNVTGMLPSGYFGKARAGQEWGFFRPGEVFAILTEQDITRFTGSGNANWRPTDYLTARATVGLDYTNRLDLQFQGLNEGPAFATFRRGRRSDNRFEIAQTTVDVSGTASFTLRPELTSKTSAGAQYLRDWFFGVTATGSEFAPGGKTVSAGALKTAGETTTETITLGFYVDQLFGWKDRLFLDLGLRVDNNSAFGASFRSAAYPKAQISWVVSDEPFFPAAAPVSNLRLRAAYGQSGVQPGSTDAQRFFQNVTATINGTDTPGLIIAAVGNDSLKPERSAEIELGFDADFLEGKAHLELTYYRKKTTDALVQRILPPSLGAAASRFENIGSVENKGVEGLITTTFNIGPSVGVDLTLAGSRNINKLITLGENVQPIIAGVQRHVPGYPLFGFWERPLRSWSDADGDGIIELSEIVVGDTAEFLGSSIPRTELSLNGGVSLFNNRLRLGGQLDYRGDFKQFNLTDYFRCTSSAANNCRAINDPSAPLWDQARAVAARSIPTGRTQGPYIEDATFLKLRELSLTYNAPDTWARALRAQRMSFTVTGRNLATFTDYTGVDPEINQIGQSDFVRDFLTQPPVTYWIFRVNLGF
ncbi:MAG TPA: SusC/RagA family TonB-linked outer membrane protein [Gemmatimonadales bacterium]|nr:SusC/RagA family TonB-linked outer membrane protein [Gemmatimonadales bacterium]